MRKIEYKNRIADGILNDYLEAMGAVLIVGPKWCGKTTTAEQAANSVVYLSDTSYQQQDLMAINISPHMVLEGDTPRLIDEWQEAPRIWDAVRHAVDHRNESGQFILTGSAVPNEEKLKEIHHTGTGRIGRLAMRPMSLWESGDSTGQVSISELFDGHTNIACMVPEKTLEQIGFLMCRGGWPESLKKKTEKAALLVAKEYFKAVVEHDISRVDGVLKNPERVKRLMRSYARLQGSQSSYSTISDDISQNESMSLSVDTVAQYINALKSIFVIEDSLAWNPNLRSKSAIRSSDTRYFVDPSITAASLDVGPKDFVNDLNTMGFVFESMAVRDLRCYADANEGTVYHYRDSSNLECDVVIHIAGGRYGLIEVKLGGDALINEGAKNLIALANKINTTKMKEPSFLMVLTAVGPCAYRRPDGVLVVPITCLKD